MTTFPEPRCRDIVERLARRWLWRWLKRQTALVDAEISQIEITQELMDKLYSRAFLPATSIKFLLRLWRRGHDVDGVQRPILMASEAISKL